MFNNHENYWVSLSDIMTGLMVIFMFIAISYILQVQRQQQSVDDLLKDYSKTVEKLYEELKVEFEEDFTEENWNAKLEDDLSIRFLNERVLFYEGDARVRTRFRAILDDFFPRYIGILLKPEYRNKIAEVRIEGHTNSRGGYMDNLRLSQERTSNVLDYIFFNSDSAFSSLPAKDKELVKFWFTANGFSSGRTIDDSGKLTLYSGKEEDFTTSRRVEFRIVMKTDELVQNIMAQKKE